MSESRVSMSFLSSAQIRNVSQRIGAPRFPLRARLAAKMYANKFDRMFAVGAAAPARSALAAHAARLTSTEEREAVARSLRRTLDDAKNLSAPVSSRVPLNIPNITAAEDRIDQVTLRLHSPRPVTPRGVARLRLLLADGKGPLYRYGKGDLEGRLGAALAAL